MKKIKLLIVLTLFSLSCGKTEFDINNPNVETFVNEIKNGTYNYYQKGEKGENLWLLMPKFNYNHIQALIDFSYDTTHIKNFPTNPVSSRMPFPYGRQYFILGECLLRIAEELRNVNGVNALDPYLIDTLNIDKFERGLDGVKILKVSKLYKDWWFQYKEKDWKNKNPLQGTSFQWF